MNGQKPREIAAHVLQRRRGGAEFVEILLDRALAGTKLSTPDRALCQELVYGVIRWQATLDWLIAGKTQGRTQKAALQDLLRLGLYQIFWLDRIPEHAAVHETVEMAKRLGFGPQAGFVNAVLRGFIREHDDTRKRLTELKTSQPALGWSHPEWLVARWQKAWGDDRTRQLLEWNNRPPETFARVNALKLNGVLLPPRKQMGRSAHPAGETTLRKIENAGDLLAQWRDEDVDYDFVRREWFEENLVFKFKSHPPLLFLPSFREGLFYIQDPSTLLAVHELDPQPGDSILDFCAAPGGKTTLIAQRMNNQGKILAHDSAPERLRLIQENCVRLGVTCVEATSAFAPLPSGFDRVLVDAPCSNTGVMRRRVDLRWRLQPEEIGRLQALQSDLLRRAASTLKCGGVLVYSTCSLEPEENAEVVKGFLSRHSDFKLERQREVFPFVEGVDGTFVARMKRDA